MESPMVQSDLTCYIFPVCTIRCKSVFFFPFPSFILVQKPSIKYIPCSTKHPSRSSKNEKFPQHYFSIALALNSGKRKTTITFYSGFQDYVLSDYSPKGKTLSIIYLFLVIRAIFHGSSKPLMVPWYKVFVLSIADWKLVCAFLLVKYCHYSKSMVMTCFYYFCYHWDPLLKCQSSLFCGLSPSTFILYPRAPHECIVNTDITNG